MITFDKQLNTIVVKKIDEIASVMQDKDINDIGLLTGKTGMALFYFYYAKFKNDSRLEDRAYDILKDVIEGIDLDVHGHSYCSGISGVAWAVEHLIQNGLLIRKEIDFLNDIDEFLFRNVIVDIRNENYDFLYGVLGITLYYLNRVEHNLKVTSYLSKILDFLENTAEEKKGGLFCWQSRFNSKSDKMVYNLGLAHGIPSIIVCLSKLSKLKILHNRALKLLCGSVDYVLHQKLNTKSNLSVFPGWISNFEKPISSRLGWCYGDLGIAVAIWHASKACNNKYWELEVIKVFKNAENRIDLEDNGVIEAIICHGTIGIAQIYHRMYIETANDKFELMGSYWVKKTLEMAKFDDGFAGYKVWRTEAFGGWQNDLSVLEGISGIGLGLLSFVSENELGWDECILLS